MVDLSGIEQEINKMEAGQKKPFGAQHTVEEFQVVYALLQDLERDGVILVKPHVESQTGLRQVDAAFVTKL